MASDCENAGRERAERAKLWGKRDGPAGALKDLPGHADAALMYVSEAVRIQREGGLARLAIAYQRREMHVFEAVCRPDMVLTLAGSSRLAGTYHGYGAFSAYLDALRDVLSSAERQITFEHSGNDMVFWQATILMGPRHHVEMTLRVTVRYHHHDGRIESFLVEPEDQALFDHIVNSAVPARSEAL